MYFDEAIVKRVREISENRKISFSRWAIRSQLAPTTIYDLINQKYKFPKLVTIKKLCDSIHMPISEFFDVDYIKSSEIRDEDWGIE